MHRRMSSFWQATFIPAAVASSGRAGSFRSCRTLCARQSRILRQGHTGDSFGPAEGRKTLRRGCVAWARVVVGGVRFLGATLWTDFALHGADGRPSARAMSDAKYGMSDFSIIRHGAQGLLRPEHARAMHLEQVCWIRERLADDSPAQRSS